SPLSPLFPYPTLFRSVVADYSYFDFLLFQLLTHIFKDAKHTHRAKGVAIIGICQNKRSRCGNIGSSTGQISTHMHADRFGILLRSEEHTSELQSRENL